MRDDEEYQYISNNLLLYKYRHLKHPIDYAVGGPAQYQSNFGQFSNDFFMDFFVETYTYGCH